MTSYNFIRKGVGGRYASAPNRNDFSFQRPFVPQSPALSPSLCCPLSLPPRQERSKVTARQVPRARQGWFPLSSHKGVPGRRDVCKLEDTCYPTPALTPGTQSKVCPASGKEWLPRACLLKSHFQDSEAICCLVPPFCSFTEGSGSIPGWACIMVAGMSFLPSQ